MLVNQRILDLSNSNLFEIFNFKEALYMVEHFLVYIIYLN